MRTLEEQQQCHVWRIKLAAEDLRDAIESLLKRVKEDDFSCDTTELLSDIEGFARDAQEDIFQWGQLERKRHDA